MKRMAGTTGLEPAASAVTETVSADVVWYRLVPGDPSYRPLNVPRIAAPQIQSTRARFSGLIWISSARRCGSFTSHFRHFRRLNLDRQSLRMEFEASKT